MYGLEKLEVAQVSCVLRSKRSAELPPYLGSTLRGALLDAMRGMFCPMRCENVETCAGRAYCPYASCFSPPQPSSQHKLRGFSDLPRPVFIVPPPIQASAWEPSQLLPFDLVFVGRSISFFQQIAASLLFAAHTGLGKGRAPFELLAVQNCLGTQRGTSLWNQEKDYFLPLQPTPIAEVFPLERGPSDTVHVTFLSPLRLVEQDRILKHLSFRSFVSPLLRRLSSFLSFHCDGELQMDIHDTLSRAESVQTLSSHLEYVPLERWSSRQNQHVPMDGMMGSILWKGDLIPDIWPLLQIGSLLHVGKGVSLGLGRYQVSSLPSF